jgi:hypothetical protein
MAMAVPVHALERAEFEAFLDVYGACEPPLADAAGIRIEPLGHATLLAASHVDVLALNRVIGLGVGGPLVDGELDAVIGAMRAAGSPRFFLPVPPVDGAPAIVATLEGAGIRHYNNWMRLWRGLDDVAPEDVPGLDVRRVGSGAAAVFAEIVAGAFGYPPVIASLPAQTLGRDGWSHYLAFEEDTPVAAAAMFVSGDAAWFGFAATRAEYRRRGAQRALILRRMRDAAEAGCRWVSVETAEDTVQRDAPSFRNMQRLGFEVAYARPNYLWTP